MMQNFTYARGYEGVQLWTARGHVLSPFCKTEEEVDTALQRLKDELDSAAAEMKASLKVAFEE